MGEVSADRRQDWDEFARLHASPLLLILLRIVHEPALAFDLATETLAAIQTECDAPPHADQALADLIDCASRQLSRAAATGRVPTVERHRRQEINPHRLTAAQQHELARLAERHLDLPENVRSAADALARSAPPHTVLKQIALSGLVEAERLPDPDAHARPDHAGHESA
jgi:hypothetical protein